MHPAVPIARIRTAPTSHGCAYASPCALSPKSHRAGPPHPSRRAGERSAGPARRARASPDTKPPDTKPARSRPARSRAVASGRDRRCSALPRGSTHSTGARRRAARARAPTPRSLRGRRRAASARGPRSCPGPRRFAACVPPPPQLQPASAAAAPPVLASPSPVRRSSLSKRCHPPAAWCDAAVGRARAGARGRVGAGRGAGRAGRAGRGGARGGAAGGGLVHGAPSVAPMRSRNRCGGVAVHSLDVREMKMRVAERGQRGQTLQLYCAAHPALESECSVASERLTDAGTVKAAARRGP